jgi:hypothetical protein
MILQVTIRTFVIMMVLSFTLLITYPHFNHAMLYENGTCTNENLTKMSKQVINTNGTVDDFLKSLPSDNMILAELVC